jgi:hypothetical protein
MLWAPSLASLRSFAGGRFDGVMADLAIARLFPTQETCSDKIKGVELRGIN